VIGENFWDRLVEIFGENKLRTLQVKIMPIPTLMEIYA
jgi:hypothetical protein